MCVLLALNFNKPVTPSFSFRGFRHSGKSNTSGWGISFFPDKSAQIIKEPVQIDKSPLANFLQDYNGLKSKTFIAHLRNASKGSVAHCNTHPFLKKLSGSEFICAHNGTIDCSELDIGRFRTIGETDSEHLFAFILQSIKKQRMKLWSHSSFEYLHSLLQEINNYGRLNIIFAHNGYLFCYHDKNVYPGLCFLRRKAPFESVRLLDEDLTVNLSEQKDPSQVGYIVSTNPLTNEIWHDFEPEELLVFRFGRIVYSSIGRSLDDSGDYDLGGSL